MNKKRIYRMVVAAVLVLAMTGIFLPGWLMEWRSGKQMNVVDAVPAEYYSPANLAVARNASASLGIYQKLQLITGRWESNASPADLDEQTMENHKAAELAKEQIEVLYQEGIYPVSLLTDYGNWYSWEAEFCKVVDSTFHTYTAYYWKLSFVKYDGSERHSVYMLEDGTVFLAEAWKENGIDGSGLSKISEKGANLSEELAGTVKQEVPGEEQRIEEYFTFADLETADLRWMDLARLQVGERDYAMLQLYSSDRYLYSLQPLD